MPINFSSKLAILLLLVLASVTGVLASGVPVDMRIRPSLTTAIYYNDALGGQRGVPIHSGDYDGDGSLDVAGAPFSANTLGRTNNGDVQIVFGDGTLGNIINMATYTGRVLKIHGAEDYSAFGVEMAAGDFDGDGYDDLVVGSSHGKYKSIAEGAGEVVILFGRAEWGTSVTSLDIKNLPNDQRAKFILGNHGFVGASHNGDRLGSWFTVADLNQNDSLDLVMGMDLSDGPNANKSNCGAGVILWDVNDAYPAAPYLRVGDPVTSDTFTIIYGRDAGDQLGATNDAGDFDNDTHPDLVLAAGVNRSGLQISALNYNGIGGGDGPANNRTNAGELTIFWNAANLRAIRTLDLSQALPGNIATTTIYGENSMDYFGEELFAADFTDDGTTDLIVGALTARHGTGIPYGATYIIPGGSFLRSQTSIDMLSPPANVFSVIDGSESNDIAGDTVELFDVNKDGKIDLFNSAPLGAPSPSRLSTGYTVVIFGGQTLPKMPTRISMTNTGTVPPLISVPIYGADGITITPPHNYGDLFAYSSDNADMDGDGYGDYIPNAMQGDGFENGFPAAGEDYIISGLRISQYASAPTNLFGNSAAPSGQVVASWDASAPILGAVTGYVLTFLPAGLDFTINVETTNLQVTDADFPLSGTILSVGAKMQRASETNYSLFVEFSPPVTVTKQATPSPTPSPSVSPTASQTPTESPTASPSATPSPSGTPAQQDGWITH